MLWKDEAEILKASADARFREKFEDELADILNYLLLIADKCDVDILDAAFKKLQKNRKKYPVDKSYGRATKYRDL